MRHELTVDRALAVAWRFCLALALVGVSTSARAEDESTSAETEPDSSSEQDDQQNDEPSKFKKFAEVVKHARHLPGLIDLYHDDRHLYAALKPSDLDTPLLAPVAVASGAGAAGMALELDDQWIVAFHRTGDRVQLVRKNVHYTAPDDSPLAKAVAQGYRDSVLKSLEIVSDDAPEAAILVDLSDVYFGNFANFADGSIDETKSRWFDVKAFPDNLELQVEVTFDGSPVPQGSGSNGDVGYVDKRGVTLVLHYSLIAPPPPGYRPRPADPRLGHFVSAVKNFDSSNPDTLFERRITRWRLEKADPQAELSPPKKQLVWWIEDTVPLIYRPYVEAGILEWNKAFERIGYQNAIAVRWQGPDDDFTPEDVNFRTFRWITSPYGYAMSNMRSNPTTGEIFDGDILFDSSWIRYWHRERAYLVGAAGEGDAESDGAGWRVGELVSPMMAAFYARQSPRRTSQLRALGGPERRSASDCRATCRCRYAASLRQQVAAARAAFPGGELPRDAIGQLIKAVAMHEMGHSLGLTHNFRGSQLHAYDDLQDTELTREHGLLGSVMDYAPVNLSGHGLRQGDYATSTLGPYDYWAIEYAYREFDPDVEAEQLQRIAARSAEPQLAYASDEDLAAAHDPRVNQYDLGADPLQFARRRIALASQQLIDVEDRLVGDGESWDRLRPAVVSLWRQYGDAAFLATRYVGGRWVSHDARNTPGAAPPLRPVPADLQRAALRFLVEEILVDEPIPLRPELLQRMTTEQWSHWGADARTYEGKVGISYFDFVAAVQEIALAELLGSGERLRRIETNQAMSIDADQALQLEDVFAACRDAAWGPAADEPDEAFASQPARVRRSLQQMHVRYLIAILQNDTRGKAPALAYAHFSGERGEFPDDARSLAYRDLVGLQERLQTTVEQARPAGDAAIAAHWQSCLHQITRALEP